MASAAQRRIKSISYAKYGYMFIAPFFLVYCFFQIWPLIQTFILSFQGNGADAGTFVGFDNYATILFGSGEGMGRRAKAMQELFLTSFKNTIILWFGNFIPQILLSLLLGAVAGYLLNLLEVYFHSRAWASLKLLCICRTSLLQYLLQHCSCALFPTASCPQSTHCC